ncbi:hypothetical protein V494_01789 [Pseudogymnoascus sp. VKM F-4513 (FW-928)]|nr:hypothetical protein V494_01789 [Pseudogymnoascus sp. VKM F-4513 (FW-928)]
MNDEDNHYNRSDWPASASEFEVLRPDIEAMLGCKEYCNMSALPTQEIGDMSAPQGRLITWPRTLQYHFEPATLVDATVPWHCQFVMLSFGRSAFTAYVRRGMCLHSSMHGEQRKSTASLMITEMTGG